jgi:hypothetical protein
MRRFTMSLSATFFTILLLVSSGIAQQAATTTVPNLIRYGGVLKDAQGAPLSSTTVGITFAIYKQQDGGAPVWMETQSVATDAGANYSALLGSTTASGLPGDLFSQEEQRWLGVQVEGQAEQQRVLLVSVPYAFKAHEAETLGGRSVSDFVLTESASAAVNGNTASPASSSTANNPATTAGVNKGAASDGPTNFSGSTTDQIVGVTQTGTGAGVNASAPTKGVVGTATATTGTAIGVEGGSAGSGGYGVYGNVTSATGATVGVKGNSQSTTGTGVRGTNIATSGVTTGVSGYVDSAAGTAGVFNNAAGGNILIGQNNGAPTFTVSGTGNVNAAGGFTGSGTGITGITFSQLTGQLGNSQFSGTYSGAVSLSDPGNSFSGTSFTGGTFTGSGSGLTGVPAGMLSGTLGSAQFSGTYSNAVMLTNTSNMFYGNGANLTMVPVGSGSPNYIQNTMSPQKSANFNITGSGVLSGTLVANAGVSGMLTIATGNAVSGMATVTSGAPNGVYGQAASPGGTGVYGTNTATSGNAYGVTGKSASATGVGVYGWATSTTGNDSGVVGQSDSTTAAASGVFGVATASTGQVYGVVGSTNSTTQNASGVYGNTTATTGATNGVYGLTNSSDGSADGVYGEATSTTGGANGVVGTTSSPKGYGVWGVANSTDTSGFGYGVYGTSANGAGVYASAQSSSVCAAGVEAYSASTCADAIYAVDTATSGNANGIYAQTNSSQGVAGYFNNEGGGYILVGTVNGNGTHLFHVDGSGDGYFAGDLNVGGTLSKGGGSFKIDDPLDPENKTLSHSFVESPDMMNIYNGLIRLDARGEAWVVLPEYFEALNRDFRYQLTSVGASQPRLYIASEVKGNRFKIAGGKANAKVSWQVTGIRQDAWANAHRIPTEEEKPLEKRGTYLHPDVFGANAKTSAMLQH